MDLYRETVAALGFDPLGETTAPMEAVDPATDQFPVVDPATPTYPAVERWFR